MAICTIINFSRCQNKMNLFKSMNSCLKQIFFQCYTKYIHSHYRHISPDYEEYNTSNRCGTVVLIYPSKLNGDSSSKTMYRMGFFFLSFFIWKEERSFVIKIKKKKSFVWPNVKWWQVQIESICIQVFHSLFPPCVFRWYC